MSWELVVQIGAAAGAFLALLALGRVVFRAWRRVEQFLDDWNGEPNRPGVRARPGVMERLDRVERQVTPNGGSTLTLADRVVRLERYADTGLTDPASLDS